MTMSFFASVPALPDDPIFGLPALFAADPHPKKVNLGIGVYKDADGKTIVLNVVRKAEELLLKQNLDKDYLFIDGNQKYIQQSLELIFGKNCPGIESKEIYAAQTVGGTGSLRLGSEFLAQEPSRTIFISEFTWPNHKPIFLRAGLVVENYDYYDHKAHKLDFPKFCKSIQSINPGSVIMLQACCHNPTGIDPTFEQWKELSDLIKKQKIIPFFDFAYQGFSEDLEKDAKAVRYFYEQGHEMLVSYSFSKNFGLYGERVGLLAVVTHDAAVAKKVGSQVKQIIRGMYSNPPLQGARIVSTVLQSPELTKEWLEELKDMRTRVQDMRETLVANLMVGAKHHDFTFLNRQKGLFSFCGLSHEQVMHLKKEFGIYMPDNGRINVAGLNPYNMDYVVKSILSVFPSTLKT